MTSRSPTRYKGWAAERVLRLPCLLAVVALAACASTHDPGSQATRAAVEASPTTTITPAGEPLRIDGQLVREVFIPDPRQEPLYSLTDGTLFVHESGRWLETGTHNDGRYLLVDPNNPDRLFRGNHPECGISGLRTKITFEMSADGGKRWLSVPGGTNVRPLAVDPSFPETIYGSDCALTTSLDGGKTWNSQQIMVGFEIVGVAFVGHQLLALGIAPDGKSRLRRIDLSDPAVPVPREVLLELPGFAYACLDASEGRLVVGGRHSVYVSDDAGTTWTSSRIGLEDVTDTRDEPPTPRAGHSTRGEYGVLAVAIDPTNKHRIVVGTVRGLFVSQDSGTTWDRYSEVNPNLPVTRIQFGLGGADMYITTSEGVIVVPKP